MSEHRSLSYSELDEIQMYAADKFGYIENHDEWLDAVLGFVGKYINGGKFGVFNARNQFLAEFEVLDDAIAYKEENEPKNEIWSIEIIDSAE